MGAYGTLHLSEKFNKCSCRSINVKHTFSSLRSVKASLCNSPSPYDLLSKEEKLALLGLLHLLWKIRFFFILINGNRKIPLCWNLYVMIIAGTHCFRGYVFSLVKENSKPRHYRRMLQQMSLPSVVSGTTLSARVFLLILLSSARVTGVWNLGGKILGLCHGHQ